MQNKIFSFHDQRNNLIKEYVFTELSKIFYFWKQKQKLEKTNLYIIQKKLKTLLLIFIKKIE